MRLKHLLVISILLLLASTPGLAANSQLTNVSVTGQGHATTVLLHANGTFTHTEYRPSDNLLLVDLSGVAAGKLKDTVQTVNKPGLASYRVLGYTGASGAEVARLEMTLTPGAVVNVTPVTGGLQISVAADADAAMPKPEAAAPAEKPAAAPAETKMAVAKAGHPAVVQHVSVMRGKSGMEVEISSSAAVTPKVMKLTAPDRIVIDLPNAVPSGRAKPIVVTGSEIKAVRMGRFQAEPPVTRVVVDLASAHDYELEPRAGKLILKLKGSEQASAPAMKPVAAAEKQPVLTAMAVEPKPAAPVMPAAAEKPAAEMKSAGDAAAKIMEGSTRRLPETSLVPPVSATLAQPAANLAAEQQQQQRPAQAGMQAQRAMQGPGGTGHYTGEPISVNLKDVDLKDFFRLIHEISGLNIILDPGVSGSLTLVLDDVPWDQALDIVLQNNGLDKRLEGNVLRIAKRDTFRAEADARRAQDEAQALAVDKTQYTHYLSYAHATEIMPIVQKFLSQRGSVVADPRLNALIITDIPSTIPAVTQILQQLDRKTQEVEIEARVVAATRNFARDIGVQLGFGWGNGVTAVGGAGSVGTSPLLVSIPNPKYFTSGGSIPLFSNFQAGGKSGISFTNATSNYRVDAILTMAESRGLLKILSRPRVVTQNNIQALVKQGVKIPVVTAAQLGGPPTTNYVEAALRLQVTPQITAEGTIFLNVDVENTTPDQSFAVGDNPALITQQATTQVLVTDGGTVVIGGVIQTQNSVAIAQTPLLGDIPILGNLFKRRNVTTTTQELIFFITPRIIQT